MSGFFFDEQLVKARIARHSFAFHCDRTAEIMQHTREQLNIGRCYLRTWRGEPDIAGKYFLRKNIPRQGELISEIYILHGHD